MKLDEYKKNYFADMDVDVKIDEKGRKKYNYVYKGIWYCWGWEGFDLTRRRVLYAAVEIIGIVLYIIAGTTPSAFNACKLNAGLSMLSIVAWLLEIRGVFGFCVCKKYMMEIDYKSIHFRITTGALLRILLMYSGAAAGLISVAVNRELDLKGFLTFLAYILCGAGSWIISRSLRKIGYHAYHNDNGKVGSPY